MARWLLLLSIVPIYITPNASWLRPPQHRDDGFVFCRLAFTSNRLEPQGSGWRTDFPRAGHRFMLRVAENTRVRVDGERQWVIPVRSDSLFSCPFVMASDVGTMSLTDDEADRLRRYLEKGGLLWVDDFWGPASWKQWLEQLAAFQPETARIVTPTWEHPIYNVQYHIRETLQVSNLDHWLGARMSGTRDPVRERGELSPETPLQVLLDADGHVSVVMTFNSDVADTWERETDNRDYFLGYAADGYALGVNVLLYAMAF